MWYYLNRRKKSDTSIGGSTIINFKEEIHHEKMGLQNLRLCLHRRNTSGILPTV